DTHLRCAACGPASRPANRLARLLSENPRFANSRAVSCAGLSRRSCAVADRALFERDLRRHLADAWLEQSPARALADFRPAASASRGADLAGFGEPLCVSARLPPDRAGSRRRRELHALCRRSRLL